MTPQSISRRWLVIGCLVAATAGGASVAALQEKEYKSGIVWPEPKVVDPGPPGGPPSDAIVLFDGKDLSKWQGGEDWEVKEGYAIARKHHIKTKDSFGDCQLHVEFATPAKVEGSGQGRGNSGVFLMDRYEVQILDSYDNKTYFDGQCASIYKQTPPMVNACRKPGESQTYDILWEGPRFGPDGKVTKPAIVTVLHNDVAVVNHFELLGSTSYDQPPVYEKHSEREPLRLQFHGNPVRFRNIWIREMKPIEGKKPG
jgi:3-keto-disaccharide hydrolase